MFARSEASGFAKEVFFLMTSWTQQFDILWATIASVFVVVMNLENLWNAIIETAFATVWTSRHDLLALNVWCDRDVAKFALFAIFPITFGRAVDVAGSENVLRVALDFSAAYLAEFYVARFAFDGSGGGAEGGEEVNCGALSTTKASLAVLLNWLPGSAMLTDNHLHWFTLVVTNEKACPRLGAGDFIAATTGAKVAFLGRVPRQVVVLGGACDREPESTAARAEFTEGVFGDGHQAFPIWQVVLLNVFGHAKDLLCGPFRKRLVVSWA